MDHVTAGIVGAAPAAAPGGTFPVTPSVAAFAYGISAELRPLAADLLALETCEECAAARPASSSDDPQAGAAWLPMHAPGVSAGDLTLLETMAASQPAMRRLAFLAEVRSGPPPDFTADLTLTLHFMLTRLDVRYRQRCAFMVPILTCTSNLHVRSALPVLNLHLELHAVYRAMVSLSFQP